jgi:hypothetical protein
MINIFRKNQQILMILVTVLVIISFVVLYNTTQFEMIGVDRAGSIYGRTISQHEVDRQERKIQLASGLGMRDYLQNISSPGEGADGAVWDALVLNREAEKLQIDPSAEAVASGIEQIPVFQTNGAFDFGKYSKFVENNLGPLGFTKDHLEELISDALRIREIKDLIGTTVTISDAEVRRDFDLLNERIKASVVRFALSDFVAGIEVTEEDLKKAFKERSGKYMSDERRKIRYVKFSLNAEQAKLEGSERIRELQKIANEAQDFAVAMTEEGSDFTKLANKKDVAVQETDYFKKGEPPAELISAGGVVTAAFQLTKDQPNSDVIQAGNDTFYVVQLSDIEESQPLAFEQAKTQVKSDLQQERGREAMDLKVANIRNQILEAIKAGKSFNEAAKGAGVTPVNFPEFSRVEPNFEASDAREVMLAAFEMSDGELSEKVDTLTGADLVYVHNREHVSDEEFEKDKATVQKSARQQKLELYYHEWLRLRRAAADVRVAQR